MRNSTRVRTSRNDPRKSTRAIEDRLLAGFCGSLEQIASNRTHTISIETRVKGTCAMKAILQSQVSFTYPPKTPPRPLPRPQKTLPIPCQTPRWCRGTKSLTRIVEMVLTHPPPTPATSLCSRYLSVSYFVRRGSGAITPTPRIIVHSSLAKPQTMLPLAKTALLTIIPHRREKISVNLPLNGCVAACPIKKAVASHARRGSELKLVAIGAARLAITVPSNVEDQASTIRKSLRIRGGRYLDTTYQVQQQKYLARCLT